MSLLALDISNSHTTFGIFEGDKLTAHWRVKSDEHRTSDETVEPLEPIEEG